MKSFDAKYPDSSLEKKQNCHHHHMEVPILSGNCHLRFTAVLVH